ncbi:MAG: methylmalonyl-CoA mutase family protein [Pseudomonadota bacterium]
MDEHPKVTDYKKKLGTTRQIKKPYTTLSGIEKDPVYFPADIDDAYMERLGLPGEYPFTRGPYTNMYRGRLWTMRMFAGFGTPEDTNQRFKYLLKSGQTGLSTAFDMPTLMGYDPDHELSLGEVGKEGVSVSNIEDMHRLFDGIPLDEVTTSMTINATAIIALAAYAAVAQERGIPLENLGGTTQNDILKEYIAQKEWISPPKPAMKLVQDTMEFCVLHMPRWHPISISGYHIREAGATAVQELAFTLADGIGYAQAGIERGLDVDEFAPRFSFFFDVHNDFFEEIAKLRAARRIWSDVMRNRFGAKDPRSWTLRTHCQTAGVSLTAQQPYNNVVRTSYQAMAAVLGGTQSLHTNSLDETFCLPTQESAKIALRTQQLLAHETGVTDVIDPLAGSYYVESLTDRVEEEAREYLRKIDDMGGILVAIEKGYPQMEIAESAYDFQRQVETGDRVIIGVNEFVDDEKVSIPMLTIDKAVEEGQRARSVELKKSRDHDKAMRALDLVRRGARAEVNLVPPIIDALKARVTLGEVSELFREEFGVYTDPAYC